MFTKKASDFPQVICHNDSSVISPVIFLFVWEPFQQWEPQDPNVRKNNYQFARVSKLELKLDFSFFKVQSKILV